VVPLDVAHAVQRHKARKGHGQVVAQAQDLAALQTEEWQNLAGVRQARNSFVVADAV